MKFRSVILQVCLFCPLLAAAHPFPQAFIVCYPVDPLIEKACAEIQRTLENCAAGKYVVARSDSPTPKTLRELLLKRRATKDAHVRSAQRGDTYAFFPSHLPVFIVGHGGANIDGTHSIATKKTWDQGGRPIPDGKHVVKTESLLQELKSNLVEPATWLMSCHSGGACLNQKNVGATCKSWEVTGFGSIETPIKQVHFLTKVDKSTREVLNLLCDAEHFKQTDIDKDRRITKSEWGTAYLDQAFEATSCPAFRLTNDSEVTRLMTTISAQLSPEDKIVKQEVVDEDSGNKLLKMEICQARCVRSNAREISPMLKNFELPSPKLQKFTTPEVLVQRAQPPTEQTHRRRLLPRRRGR